MNEKDLLNAIELEIGDWVCIKGSYYRLTEVTLTLDTAPAVRFTHTSEMVEKRPLGFA